MEEKEKNISYPISQTGGRGYDFEDFIATYYLLAMIAGKELWGPEYGYITKIDWQTNADGWLFDDLLLTLKDHIGVSHRVAISIKSNTQLTSNGFPNEITKIIWRQFLDDASPFDASHDLLFFIVGEISNNILSDWNDIHREVVAADDERIAHRLSAEGAWSKSKKELFNSLGCSDEKYKGIDLSICKIIRRLNVKSFDFFNQTSTSYSDIQEQSRNLCVTNSYDDGEKLITKLLCLCKEKRGAGGGVTINEIYNIPFLPCLVAHPIYYSDIKLLEFISQENIDLIQDTLSNGITISRKEICNKIESNLDEKKVVSVVGQSGIGKSVIIKKIYSEKSCHYKFWFSNKNFDVNNLQNPLISVIENIPSADVLLVVDSIERFDDNQIAMLDKIISIAKRRGFYVLISTTHLWTPKLESFSFEVPLLTYEDLKGVFEQNKTLYSLWKSKGMDALMCIPKILDWCIELVDISSKETLDPINFADHLWNKWIQQNTNDRHLRSQILKEIANFDGDNITPGVYISKISNPMILGTLENDNLIYIKDELIFWKHDLIGDWAREKILLENKDSFLGFVNDKYHKPQWKHSILLFGQWLLSNTTTVDKWIEYVNKSKDELQYLLLDSVIFSNRSFELCDANKDVLLDNKSKLFNLLLNRLLLVASYQIEINNQNLICLNLRLCLPFLYFIDKYSEKLIPECNYLISKICSYYLLYCQGTSQSKKAARLSIEVAKFAYKNEKKSQANRKLDEYLYLEKEMLECIWISFLLAFREFPEEVIRFSLVLAEIEDPKDEELKSLLALIDTSNDNKQNGFLFPLNYIPPWPNGPKRNISEGFREICLTTNLICTFFDKYPLDATRILMAVCIEAPHYCSGIHDLLEECGLYKLDNDDCACCYFEGPWLQLLEKHPNIALKITIDLINFSTEQFVKTGKQHEQKRAKSDSNDLLVKLSMPSSIWEIDLLKEETKEQIVWIGDERVFGWHRNRLIHSPIIPTILMALEKWFYDLIEKKENIDSYINYIFENNKSVAIGGVLCSVIKKYPNMLYGKLKLLASSWQFLEWDIKISLDDSWKIGFGLYYKRLDKELYNKALEWNQMSHRKQYFKDTIQVYLQYALVYDWDVSYFNEVSNFWKKQNENSRTLQFLIEQINPNNYKKNQLSDGKVEVQFSYPLSLKSKITDENKEQDASISIMHFPFSCRERIEKTEGLSDEDAESIWNSMNEIADFIQKNIPSESKDKMNFSFTYQDIYCAGICTILHLNPDYIMRSDDKKSWVLKTIFQIYDNQPIRHYFDTPTMHLSNSWDSFIGEISILLCKLLPQENDIRVLLANSLLLFHYEAIKSSLNIARMELKDEYVLINLVNLHIQYSFARGLLWLDEIWKGKASQNFKNIGNQKICNYYNDFCLNKTKDKQVINIIKLHEEYLKIRNKILQFDVLLMLQSKNVFVRIYARTLLKIHKIFNHDKKNLVLWTTKNKNQNFMDIYNTIYLRQQICDFEQLALVADIVDFSKIENFSYKNQFNLLVQLETLMLMSLKCNPNEKNSNQHDSKCYPNESERSCLNKIANSLAIISPEDAKILWQPVFRLDQCYYAWIEVFVSFFICSSNETNLKQFSVIWRDMIVFVDKSWDVKSNDIEKIILKLLGIYNKEKFWSDYKIVPIIEELAPFYLKWEEKIINHYNINNYLAFCASVAGAPLLENSLLLIADALEGISSRYDKETPVLATQLCKQIWKDYQNLLKNKPEFKDAFFRILSKSISMGCKIAIDFQNEIKNSNT